MCLLCMFESFQAMLSGGSSPSSSGAGLRNSEISILFEGDFDSLTSPSKSFEKFCAAMASSFEAKSAGLRSTGKLSSHQFKKSRRAIWPQGWASCSGGMRTRVLFTSSRHCSWVAPLPAVGSTINGSPLSERNHVVSRFNSVHFCGFAGARLRLLLVLAPPLSCKGVLFCIFPLILL